MRLGAPSSVPSATRRSQGSSQARFHAEYNSALHTTRRSIFPAEYNSALRLVLGDAEDFAEAGEAVLGELEAGLA